MPSYSYTCLNCNCCFELFAYIKDYDPNPKCSSCNSKKTERNYITDLQTINASVKKSDSELRTIGDLANRNRDKLSEDQKLELHNKHNSYKEQQSDKPLPKGMTRLKKQPKIKWTT